MSVPPSSSRLSTLLAAARTQTKPLTSREWQLFVTVLQLTLLVGRDSVETYHHALSRASGIDAGSIGRVVRRLVDRDLVAYRPGGHRGQPSLVAMPRWLTNSAEDVPNQPAVENPGIAAPLLHEGFTPEGLVSTPSPSDPPDKSPASTDEVPQSRPCWRPSGEPTTRERALAVELLDGIRNAMVRELDDGGNEYQRLYDDLSRLDQRARVCKWLAACAEHPARSMIIDQLSASYQTARSPAAAFYRRLEKTVSHFEAQGWSP